MKLHLISLEQDSERIQEEMSQFEYNMDSSEYETLEIEDISLNGQIIATRHLLSVATDIMNNSNERYNNGYDYGRHWAPAPFATLG
jgi:hypothetical protein